MISRECFSPRFGDDFLIRCPAGGHMGPPLQKGGCLRRAGEDTRPYEMRGPSGLAVGADDLGGPRTHTVRPYGGKRTTLITRAVPLIRLAYGQPPSPKGNGLRAADSRPYSPPETSRGA